MKAIALIGLAAVVLAVGSLCIVPGGCEQETDTGGLFISPDQVVLTTNSNQSVSFTASSGSNPNPTTGSNTATDVISPLLLPLTWSVSQPSLGYIEAHAGADAVYIRNPGIGVNIITVVDQGGHSAIATVEQQ